ncbi:hypothetical protein TREES_T100000867 [Tupaia chinensis]|uniref:Uncharacterized protein n=1 Tax=Tupaia chinensis TaxID=246437 RepID=L9JFB1_TUPCH|nr:hypothetical protein TREES_T100000867 [Tupaia chinensis]
MTWAQEQVGIPFPIGTSGGQGWAVRAHSLQLAVAGHFLHAGSRVKQELPTSQSLVLVTPLALLRIMVAMPHVVDLDGATHEGPAPKAMALGTLCGTGCHPHHSAGLHTLPSCPPCLKVTVHKHPCRSREVPMRAGSESLTTSHSPLLLDHVAVEGGHMAEDLAEDQGCDEHKMPVSV